MRKIKIGITFFAIFNIIFVFLWLRFLSAPIITENAGLQYTVAQGSSIKTVIYELTQKKVIKHPIFFHLLIKLRGDQHDLKAGEYWFAKGTTPQKMLNQMMMGTGFIYHSFTIVPGWTFKELMRALKNSPDVRPSALSPEAMMTAWGFPNLNPEGQFFPDTYFFTQGSTDIVVLRKAFEAMQHKFTLAWQNRARNLPYKTPYDALIAASLVEKEAYFKSERPKIAGVLVNRLRKDMLLQFDPTLIYGLARRYTGSLSKEDLIFDTPYNTYLHKGLPPTPIAMPSLDSINASLHPEQHDYLYFVARGDGSHQFSKNLSEHYFAIMQTKRGQKIFFNEEIFKRQLNKIFF